jgi:uncharacterized membrane protein (DUF2068 family)
MSYQPMITGLFKIAKEKREKIVLRLIAGLKFLKSVLLLSLGFGAFKLLNPAVEQRVEHWINSLSAANNHRITLYILEKISGLQAAQLKLIGIGAFLFSILYFVEGIGLWFSKKWAEYLTLVATSLFLPFEIYELFEKISLSHCIALLANIAIVIYLYIITRRHKT